MKNIDLKPAQISGVNYAYPEHTEKIAESMRKHGWEGRALLVEEVKNFEHIVDYYAWTGSHRVEAAKIANIDTIPCRAITKEEAKEAFEKAGYAYYKFAGFVCWREYLSIEEGPGDKDRLRGLEKAGLTEAADMLREEIREQERNPIKRDR